jgi:two-component system, NarL family, response regulator NreC
MINLAIVDDHQLFLKGMASILIQNSDITTCEIYLSGKSFLESINQKGFKPHVVLLDISMPEIDGFDVLETLKKMNLGIKCIMVSMHEEGDYIVKSLKLGAWGYLLKNSDENEVISAIIDVFNNKKYFRGEISDTMLNYVATETNEFKKLTPKETEVLVLIADGMTNQDIADKLFISERTVETHRSNILKKLEAKNTAELIKKAINLKII